MSMKKLFLILPILGILLSAPHVAGGVGPQMALSTLGGFSPSQRTQLEGWWYAPDFAGADGASVDNLDGRDANDRDATQGTAGNRPTYESDAGSLITGKPVIHFDGSNDCLEVADADGFTMATGGTDTNWLISAVMRINDVTTTNQCYFCKDNVNTTTREWGWGMLGGGTNDLRIFLKGDTAGTAEQIGRDDTAFGTGLGIYQMAYTGSALASGITEWKNGTQIDDADAGITGVYGSMDNTSAKVFIGCHTATGGAYARFGFFDMGEVIISKAVTDLTTARIEDLNYLRSRWPVY